MKIKTLAFALAISTAMTGVANAAVFTKTYEVKSVFTSEPGALFTPPYKSVFQTFKVTFDPSKTDYPVVSYKSDAGGVFF